jgi:hypothetical protein
METTYLGLLTTWERLPLLNLCMLWISILKLSQIFIWFSPVVILKDCILGP